MTDRLTIRRYRAGDKNAVWRVHERAFKTALDAFHPELDRDLRRIPEAYLETGEFLVGTVEHQVVAIGGFQPVGDDEVVEIKRMRVDPSYQRQGFGRTLLDAVEDCARRRGFERAVLHTSEYLEAANAFYRAAGYRELDRERHPEGDFELIRYGKPL